jgi:hypothetical protein
MILKMMNPRKSKKMEVNNSAAKMATHVYLPTDPQSLAYGPLNASQGHIVKSRRQSKVTETIKDTLFYILLGICWVYWMTLLLAALILAAPFYLVLCIVDWLQGKTERLCS